MQDITTYVKAQNQGKFAEILRDIKDASLGRSQMQKSISEFSTVVWFSRAPHTDLFSVPLSFLITLYDFISTIGLIVLFNFGRLWALRANHPQDNSKDNPPLQGDKRDTPEINFRNNFLSSHLQTFSPKLALRVKNCFKFSSHLCLFYLPSEKDSI